MLSDHAVQKTSYMTDRDLKDAMLNPGSEVISDKLIQYRNVDLKLTDVVKMRTLIHDKIE